MNRRAFLQFLGASAGAGAVYCAMQAMNLLASPRTPTTRALHLEGSSNGTRVLILGAGLAGMCASYELTKAGYDCSILEARARPGGRCHTIRRGCEEVEIDGRSQSCTFDDGLYFNPGPARIPQHHLTLDYCRELNIAVEPFININDAAYVFSKGKRVRVRNADAAARADTDEIILKASSPEALDQPISRDEAKELLRLVRGHNDPETQHLVMFQIVGGTDRLAAAFAGHLGSDITYNAKITEIRQEDAGVTAYYVDRLGREQRADADYCICTIPLCILKDIAVDLSPKLVRAIASVRYMPAAKTGLQFKRRFWEEDDRIFGGITQTDASITQIFYPSYGFLSAKGLVVGCYNYGPDAVKLGELSPAQRVERVVNEGKRIHPQYREDFECGFACAWNRMPFSLGAWAALDWDGRRGDWKILREPDGRIYLAGEHCSDLTGWMAGALQSARDVSEAIHRRVHA